MIVIITRGVHGDHSLVPETAFASALRSDYDVSSLCGPVGPRDGRTVFILARPPSPKKGWLMHFLAGTPAVGVRERCPAVPQARASIGTARLVPSADCETLSSMFVDPG